MTYLLIKTNTNIKHSPQEFQSAVFQTYRARKHGLLFPHSFLKPPNWWSWLWWWWWWWWRWWWWWWWWCKVANPANAQRSARLLPESLKLCLGLGPEHFDWRDYHQHHHDHNYFPSFVEGWDLRILIIVIIISIVMIITTIISREFLRGGTCVFWLSKYTIVMFIIIIMIITCVSWRPVPSWVDFLQSLRIMIIMMIIKREIYTNKRIKTLTIRDMSLLSVCNFGALDLFQNWFIFIVILVGSDFKIGWFWILTIN